MPLPSGGLASQIPHYPLIIHQDIPFHSPSTFNSIFGELDERRLLVFSRFILKIV